MSLEKVLSKNDAVNLLELIQAIHSCNKEDDFIKHIAGLNNLIPFDFATAGLATMNVSNEIESYNLINISYPTEWLNLYAWKQYHLTDPIVRSNFKHFKVQYWTDTYKIHPPSKDFILLAEDFGLRTGYTHGAQEADRNAGSLFSVSGNSVEHSYRTEAILEYVMPHFHQALLRILNLSNTEKHTMLSHREKEVLEWISNGKSTWEISVLLGVSENTVKFHVKNIFKKLDVISRTQAVAVALEQGLINVG